MEEKWKKFLKKVVPWIALVVMVVSFVLMVVFGIHIIVAVAGKASFWIFMLKVTATAWFGVNALWNFLIWLLIKKAYKR